MSRRSDGQLLVPDMMCEFSCVEQVKEALAAQPGVKEVQVDFEAKRATVAVDADKFDAEAAIAALVDYQFTNSQLIEDSTSMSSPRKRKC